MAIYASLDNDLIEEHNLTEDFFEKVGFASEKPVQSHDQKQLEQPTLGGFMNLDEDVELDSALRPNRERGSSFKSMKTPGRLTNKK